MYYIYCCGSIVLLATAGLHLETNETVFHLLFILPQKSYHCNKGGLKVYDLTLFCITEIGDPDEIDRFVTALGGQNI